MNQLIKKKVSEVSKKKKKGFTLIELIIVIAIIAILAAIAIPQFGAARKKADTSADVANAKIIATAVATAVANGDASPESSDTFKKYIDGGNVPKTRDGKDFEVTYDDTDGVKISADKTQVYPESSGSKDSTGSDS